MGDDSQMKNAYKKFALFIAATFVVVLVCLALPLSQARADDPQVPDHVDIPDDEFVLDILPEMFLRELDGGKEDIFRSPLDTISVNRTAHVLGSIWSKPVAEVWKNIAFHIYDEQGNLIKTDKGIYNPSIKFGTGNVHGINFRESGSKFILGLKKNKKYRIKIDTSTLPAGYYAWLSNIGSGYGEKTEDFLMINGKKDTDGEGLEAIYDGTTTKPYCALRFHMDIVNIIWAKNKEVAKDIFVMNGDKATGLNPKYKAGKDYVITQISADSNPTTPTPQEFLGLCDEGYVPLRATFTYKGKTYTRITPYHNYGYLRWWKDEVDHINTFEKFKSTSCFVMTLDARIPQVTFILNHPDNPRKKVATLPIYYKKSLANNCVGEGAATTCLQKELPTVPAASDGKVCVGWNLKPDGTGTAFTKDSVVTHPKFEVYGQWTMPPVLEVKNATIVQGDTLDLKSLITKASDTEDGGNLHDQVVIEKGNFDTTKPGAYEITYTLTDSAGARATAKATVTVKKKAVPPTPPAPPAPNPAAQPTPQPVPAKPTKPSKQLAKKLPKTGDASLVLQASVLTLAGVSSVGVSAAGYAFGRKKQQ